MPPVLGGRAHVRGRLGLLQASRRRRLDVGRCEPRAGEPLGGAARVARAVGDAPSPMRIQRQLPSGAGRPVAATLTTAKSPWRRACSTTTASVPKPSGNSTASSISVGSSAVVYGPWKNASASSSRRPARPDDAQARAERHRAERHLAGRIGVAQRAAERAAIADLAVADERDGLREQRDPLADNRRRLQRRVPGERPDAHHAVARHDAIEPGNPVDVDDRRRPQEPHAQERHEALPAREQPRVAVEAREAARASSAVAAARYSSGAGFIRRGVRVAHG